MDETGAPGDCTALLLLNTRGPKGMASDGVDHLYLAGPSEVVGVPTAGAALGNTPVQQYTISTGQLVAYSSVGTNADGSQQPYGFVFSLAVDPDGDLYVSDYPSAVAPPNNLGHLYKVAGGQAAAATEPSITSKPGNPTNATTPTFAFATAQPTPNATFACSLTPTGAPDQFAACVSGQAFGPLADGNYTFKVTSSDPTTKTVSTPASYAFQVDTVVPVVTVTPGASTSTSPTFALSGSKANVAFQCSLSTGADQFVACPAQVQYPALAAGTYIFKVVGVDLAGNASAPLTLQVNVTATAFTVTQLSTPPPAPSTGGTAVAPIGPAGPPTAPTGTRGLTNETPIGAPATGGCRIRRRSAGDPVRLRALGRHQGARGGLAARSDRGAPAVDDRA